MDDIPLIQRLLNEVDALEVHGGIDMNELLNISDELRQLLVWMIRCNGFHPKDIEENLSCTEAEALEILELLGRKALITEEAADDTQVYYVQMAGTRSGRKFRVAQDIWKVID